MLDPAKRKRVTSHPSEGRLSPATQNCGNCGFARVKAFTVNKSCRMQAGKAVSPENYCINWKDELGCVFEKPKKERAHD